MSIELWLSQALSCYKLDMPSARLIRHNENAAWQITDISGNRFVLRVHQPREGFSQALFDIDKAASLQGELALLRSLGEQGEIPVQTPVLNRAGEVLSRLPGGEYATLLTWLDGDTLEHIELMPSTLTEIGRMTARIHSCFQKAEVLPAPAGRAYDKLLAESMKDRLLNMGLSGRISKDHVNAMTEALTVIGRRMTELDGLKNSFGIVHSDLSKSNMLLHEDRVAPIDFGLWGYGYYYMDLGALASHFTKEEQQQAIFAGYESVAGFIVEQRFVQPFISLGILLYICAFGEHVCTEAWFSNALDRWRQTFFQPLAEGAC